MKKFLVFPILLFIFLFSSCANVEKPDLSTFVTFSIETNQNGGVCQNFSFPARYEKMGLDESEKKLFVDDLILALKLKMFFPYFYNYYQISSKLDFESCMYKFGGEFVKYQTPWHDETTQTINFSFVFENADAWEKYHPSNGDDGMEKEKGFLFDKYVSKGGFVFSGEGEIGGKTQTIGEYIVDILSTVEEKYFDGNLGEISFAYEQSTFTNKVKSNADIQTGGSHIWLARQSELKDGKEVEIYVLSPNRGVWYGLALGVACVFTSCSFLIYYLTHRKKS